MLYDSKEIWASDRALRAFHHGFLLVDPWHQSPSYIHRLLKYCSRFGFAIVDPAMDERLKAHSDSYMPAMQAAAEAKGKSGLSEWQGLARLLLQHSSWHTLPEDDEMEPVTAQGREDGSFYANATMPHTLHFACILSEQCKVRQPWALANVYAVDLNGSAWHSRLAEASNKLQRLMHSGNSQQFSSSLKHQPNTDWYAHVQQLVQASKATACMQTPVEA